MWILGLKGLIMGMMCNNARFVKDVSVLNERTWTFYLWSLLKAEIHRRIKH